MAEKSAFRVLYVDDEITDRVTRGIQRRLSLSGELECTLLRPTVNLVENISYIQDALLVDLDLTTQSSEESPASYFGSTLAAEVRLRNPACPIILITREQVLAGRDQLMKANFDVDLILYKDDFADNYAPITEEIVTLIRGFKALDRLKQQNRGWEGVIELLQASALEEALLREAGPPVQERQWNVPQTVRWLRSIVLEYPGIFYDELTAATRLGIDVEAFGNASIQELLAPAKYVGPFSATKPRWWRERLFYIARELTTKHGFHGSISRTFRDAVEAELQTDIAPALCVYDGTATADWVCYIERKPVKQSNSIPYYPDNRPSVMDQARVSFTAVKYNNKFDETRVDKDAYDIVRELWGLNR